MPHTAQARHARPRYPGHGRMRRASRVRRRARQAAVRCSLGADTSQIATFAATRVLTVRYGDRRGGTAGDPSDGHKGIEEQQEEEEEEDEGIT